MIGNTVFLVVSLLVSGATWYLYALLRASGLREQRMNGFNLLCVIVPFWIILNAVLQITAPELFPVVYVLRSIPLNIVPYLSCWFLLHYSESKAVNYRFLRVFSFVMPALALSLLFTNPLHNQYYLSIGNPPVVGPAFMAHFTVSMTYMLTVYVVLFRYVLKNYRKNPLLIVGCTGAVIPVVIYAVYLFMPNAPAYDFTSIGYFFTIIFVMYASYYSRIKYVKPGMLGDTLAKISNSEAVVNGMIEAAAQLIAREACPALNTYRTRVWKYDTETSTLKSIAAYDNSNGDYISQVDFDMNGIAGFEQILLSERVIVVNNVREAKEGMHNPYDPEVCAVIIAPIRIEHKPIGLVCIEQNYSINFPTSREWTPEEQSFASSLADLMVLTISNNDRLNLIQQLKANQAALKESEENVLLLLDSAPLSVNLLDKNFKCVFVNEAAVRLYGLSDKQEYIELFGRGNLSNEKGIDHIRQAYENGYCHTEMTFQKPDGEQLPCELTLVRVKYKGDNAIAAYARDLREEKAAAKKIRETETQKLSVEETNRRLQAIAEKEQEANQLKSRFLATMSHEIRTPMNAVIGLTELALREEDHKIKNEHIGTVKQAASTLLAIVNDILDFSKIEAGKLEVLPHDYSVAALLSDMVSIINTRVADLQIHFTLKVESKIPHTLYGDETKIRQAVLNVLTNAVKYTEKGSVTLGVYADFIDDDTVNLSFEVVDTGIGIKPEDIDKLFSGFIQFDLEKNRDTEGTGLGLAITKSILDAMNGSISVDSEYNKGSTFTLKIPHKYHTGGILAEVDNPDDKNVLIYERRAPYSDSLVYTLSDLGVKHTHVTKEDELYKKLESREYNYLFISYTLLEEIETEISGYENDIKIVVFAGYDEAMSKSNPHILAMPVYCVHIADILNDTYYNHTYTADTDAIAGFSAPDARVLVVDDIKTNLKVAEGLLLPYKIQVDLCSGGEEAIAAVLKEKYDLVFMDHKMPKVNGVEATIRIRAMGENNPYLKELPIIALTANAVSGVMEMFIENGLNDFLAKPIDTISLNKILEKWIPKEKQLPR